MMVPTGEKRLIDQLRAEENTMSIVKRILPYEILFRLVSDGSIAGCHQKDLQILVDEETEEILSTKELDPVPITEAGLSDVGGIINGVLVTEKNELQLLLSVANQELGDAMELLAISEQANTQLSNELTAARLEIQELQSSLLGNEGVQVVETGGELNE